MQIWSILWMLILQLFQTGTGMITDSVLTNVTND